MNMVLLGLVIASGGMLLYPLLSRGMRPGAEVTPIEAVTLINRKDQLLRAAFYEVARNDAEVKNYFADTIVARDDQ